MSYWSIIAGLSITRLIPFKSDEPASLPLLWVAELWKPLLLPLLSISHYYQAWTDGLALLSPLHSSPGGPPSPSSTMSHRPSLVGTEDQLAFLTAPLLFLPLFPFPSFKKPHLFTVHGFQAHFVKPSSILTIGSSS